MSNITEIRKQPTRAKIFPKGHPGRAFIELGWNPIGEPDESNNVLGKCPFCGKPKMYFNTEKTFWDCKACGKEGGFKSFIEEIHKKTLSETTEIDYKYLAAIKTGIKADTLEEFKISYQSSTKQWLVPYFKEGVVSSLKRFDPDKKTFFQLTSTKLGLFGADDILTEHKNIYLCEGEWDRMIMQQTITRLKRNDTDVAVSLPGATAFREDFHHHFKGKNVFCMFDHDEAGKKGALKAFGILQGVGASAQFLQWDNGTKDKTDIRDLFNNLKLSKKFFRYISERMGSEPCGATVEELEKAKSRLELAPVYDGKMITPSEVYKVYNKWLKLEDNHCLDVMFGSCIANRLDGDPVWIFLVAPSGGTKSVLTMSISEATCAFPCTTLTSASLISGAPNKDGEDPSLIPKLNEKILIVKDFTTVLSAPEMERDSIFGILRDVYDGKIEKYFGTGTAREYSAYFGIVAGVTPAIDKYTEQYTSVGERFLKYNIPVPANTEELVYKALMNSNKETTMKQELEDIGSAVLAYNYMDKPLPEMNDEIAEKVVCLAIWVANTRGAVMRDRFSKEVTHMPYQELGTRLAKQFHKLMSGIAMFHGRTEITQYELDMIKDVALSTIPRKLKLALVPFIENPETTTTIHTLTQTTGLPEGTTRAILENLSVLKIIQKIDKVGTSKPTQTYILNEYAKTLMIKSTISGKGKQNNVKEKLKARLKAQKISDKKVSGKKVSGKKVSGKKGLRKKS